MDPASSYHQQGFFVVPEPVVPADLVVRACRGMDAVREGTYDTGEPPQPSPWNPGDDPTRLCKIEQPQFADRSIRELIGSPAIGEQVAALTGAEMVQVWWVQLLYKPSVEPGQETATRVGWHRDWSYWQNAWEDGSELLTVWFALGDVGADCGPVRFVDGSHRWQDLEGGDFYSQDLAKDAFNVPTGQTWQEIPGLMQAGGLSLHHCLTLHGSGPNTSGQPRRSFAIHLRTQNSRARGNKREHLTGFIDDLERCPIIFGGKVPGAF